MPKATVIGNHAKQRQAIRHGHFPEGTFMKAENSASRRFTVSVDLQIREKISLQTKMSLNVDSEVQGMVRTVELKHAPISLGHPQSAPQRCCPSLSAGNRRKPTDATDILSTYGEAMIADDHRVRTDQELLEEFFERNPKLNAQLKVRRKHHRTRMTDEMMVLDHEFDQAVYNRLMSKSDWANDKKRLTSNSVLNFLGISASHLSKGRTVVRILKAIGPESPTPHPAVEKRLNSPHTTGKGEELCAFLKRCEAETGRPDVIRASSVV